jgi:hypothetical protein
MERTFFLIASLIQNRLVPGVVTHRLQKEVCDAAAFPEPQRGGGDGSGVDHVDTASRDG